MKKQEIYVVIDSEEKRQRAIQILSDAGEKIYRESKLFETYNSILHFIFSEVCNHWEVGLYGHKTEITLDQLEQLLLPKQGYICPQTKIQCDDECCVSAEDCHITSSLDSGIVDCEPKQEIKMELDALKLIAESWGFELVEKKREIKVGDFGKFWEQNETACVYGFLIENPNKYYRHNSEKLYNNFTHLTDEEKQQIQENW